MKKVNEEDHSILKQMALTKVQPIDKMVEYTMSKYEVSKEEATEICYDILNRAGAELGFNTKYSQC